jgi:hypothetical protein
LPAAQFDSPASGLGGCCFWSTRHEPLVSRRGGGRDRRGRNLLGRFWLGGALLCNGKAKHGKRRSILAPWNALIPASITILLTFKLFFKRLHYDDVDDPQNKNEGDQQNPSFDTKNRDVSNLPTQRALG